MNPDNKPKTYKGSACIPHKGKLDMNGYALIGSRVAHRIIYAEKVGELIKGMEIDHACHSFDKDCQKTNDCPHRSCVNPDHYEQVTRAENLRRQARNRCKYGHLYSPDNVYRYTFRGTENRRCRKCSRKNQTKYYWRKVEKARAK